MSATIRTPKKSDDLVNNLKHYAGYYHDAIDPENCDEYESDRMIHYLRSFKNFKGNVLYSHFTFNGNERYLI